MANPFKYHASAARSIGNIRIFSQFKMKHLLLVVIAIVAFNVATDNKKKNGWYLAKVGYKNFRTAYEAEYVLNVKVKNDRVVVIKFPKGGSLHSGQNNSGYKYSGGELKRISGSLYGATVNVVLKNGSTLQYYVIPTLYGFE